MSIDLVLSSGFLGFSRHVGFLGAVEEVGGEVEGVCGTSSGALVGALWASGLPADEIGALLSEHRPMAWLRVHRRVWRGAMSLSGLVERLSELVPPTFEELERPFGVGVRRADGSHAVITAGPLPEAVAASCAIPGVFAPVDVGGELLSDGGAVDGLGMMSWRAWRGPRPTWAHVIEATYGARRDQGLEDCVVVHSASSRASFLSLRDFDVQVDETRLRALEVLMPRGARAVLPVGAGVRRG